MRSLLYTGSFDPITYGHIDLIKRAVLFSDHLTVGIGKHHTKSAYFSLEERLESVHSVCHEISEFSKVPIDVLAFDGMTIDFAKQIHASVLVRGIRNITDYAYEAQIAEMNRTMAPEIDTIFIQSSPSVSMISSTLVRQIGKLGGDLSPFVPRQVIELFIKKEVYKTN